MLWIFRQDRACVVQPFCLIGRRTKRLRRVTILANGPRSLRRVTILSNTNAKTDQD
jgi:hypothetical protein